VDTEDITGKTGASVVLEAEEGSLPSRVVRPGGADGALPVVVQVFGAWTSGPLGASSDVVPEGSVVVRPSLADPAWGDGTDDRRGPLGRAAVAAALRYAAGQEADSSGCRIRDRAPEADSDRVVLLGMSNGGNLVMATLADPALDLATPAGVVTWETPAGAAFVNHEFAGADALYAPASCALDALGAVVCPLPDVPFGVDGDSRCFDTNGDGDCEGEEVLHGTLDPSSDRRVLSPPLLAAALAAGAAAPDWASPEESATFWAERDASVAAVPVVERFPDLGFLLLASETDHAAAELEDHPHVFGFGEALHRAGAAWVRLNPGREFSGFQSENAVNAPLRLAAPVGWLLDEEDESPLRECAGWAVAELAARASPP
jgi:acetyl esterase/lipase